MRRYRSPGSHLFRAKPTSGFGSPDVSARALITGASRGIGRAIAVKLASQGFAVVVNYRERREEAEKTASIIRDAGGDVSLLPFDVSLREAAKEAIAADIAANGSYFGVVCNAGVHADSAFPGMTGDAWDRVLDTNLGGFYNVVHPTLMPMVRAHKGGRIVTIASASGIFTDTCERRHADEYGSISQQR